MKDNIYIKIGEEYLDLSDDISIQFTWNSPLFDANVLKGSYSYPFNISLVSSKNRRLMQRADDIKNAEKIPTRIDCILGLFGKEYTAYLKISSASRGSNASVACFIKDTLLVDSKENDIRTFDIGEINIFDPNLYKNATFFWGYTGPDHTGADMNIELNNFTYNCTIHEFYSITISSVYRECVDNLIDQINLDTSEHLLVASRGPEIPGPGFPLLAIVCVNPGVASRLEMTRVYDTVSFNVVFPFLTSQANFTNGHRLAAYMNSAMAGTGDTRICFSPLYFENLYSDITYDWYPVANYWDGTQFLSEKDSKQVPIIPMPYFKFVIENIFLKLGYKITGQFFSDPELAKIVFFSAKPADYVQPVMYRQLDNSTTITNTNVYADVIPLAEQLPSLSISKMISMHRNTFAAYYIFNNEEKTIKIGLLKSVLEKSNYIDWENKSLQKQTVRPLKETGVTLKYSNDSNDLAIKELVPSIDGYNIKTSVVNVFDLPDFGNEMKDLRLVTSINSYYYVTYELIGSQYKWNWYFHSLNLYDYVYKGGSLQIDSGNSLHLMKNISLVPMPYFNQAATSIPYNQPSLSFSNRLMFFRGVKTLELVAPGVPIYFTTPSITREADSTEKYSMQWEGEKGLYEQFYKAWLNFLTNAVPVEKELYLQHTDLNNIQWDEWYRTEGVLYLIETLKFTVTKKTLSTVKANLYAKP